MKKGDKLEGLEAKEKAVNEKLTKLEEENKHLQVKAFGIEQKELKI